MSSKSVQGQLQTTEYNHVEKCVYGITRECPKVMPFIFQPQYYNIYGFVTFMYVCIYERDIYIYIYIYVCVCMYVCMYIYICKYVNNFN